MTKSIQRKYSLRADITKIVCFAAPLVISGQNLYLLALNEDYAKEVWNYKIIPKKRVLDEIFPLDIRKNTDNKHLKIVLKNGAFFQIKVVQPTEEIDESIKNRCYF